jgi:hypothetical protein
VLDHTNARKRERSVSGFCIEMARLFMTRVEKKRYAFRMENMKSRKRMRKYF